MGPGGCPDLAKLLADRKYQMPEGDRHPDLAGMKPEIIHTDPPTQ